MADLSPSAASVAAYDNAIKVNGKAGMALTIGLSVYKKSSDKKWYSADNDVNEAADEYGVTLTNAAAADQPVVVQVGGDFNPGATAAVGVTYCVGAAAGGIAPDADVTSGKYKRIIGVAITASKIRMPSGGVFNSGVAVA